MSNFRKALARAGSILLVVMCVVGMLIPAHAEDGNEVIPVTDVLYCDSNVLIMGYEEEEDVTNSPYYPCFSVLPYNANEKLEYFVKDGVDVIDIISDNHDCILNLKKEGYAVISVKTDSGFEKDFPITVLKGSYATGIERNEYTYGRSVGEKISLKDDIQKYLYSSYTLSKNYIYYDELSHFQFEVESGNDVVEVNSDGIVTCVSEGRATITTSLAVGWKLTFYVNVNDKEVQNIGFGKDNYNFQINTGFDMTSYLTVFPEEVKEKVNFDEIHWSSSNTDIVDLDYSWKNGAFYSAGNEGSVVITAEWNGLSASTTVNMIDGINWVDFEKTDFNLAIGNSAVIQYVPGKNNQIVSKKIIAGEDCIRLEGDEIVALSKGFATIEYKDLFDIPYRIYVYVYDLPTSISFTKDEYIFTLRPENEWIGNDQYGYLGTNMTPYDYCSPVKYKVLDGDCIYIPEENSSNVILKHSGIATVKCETENGLYAIARVKVIQGTYGNYIDDSNLKISVAKGEKIDLKEEVRKRLISGTDSDDFTDEINELKFENTDSSGNYTIDDNGIFHSLKAGKYYVGFSLANGNSYSFEINSSETVRSIRFGREDYYFPLNTDELMSDYLRYVPEYMQGVIDSFDIKWSSSDSSVADFDDGNSYLSGKNEGITIVTAEYKGLKATATVHFINADTQFYPEGKENWSDYIDINLKPGEKTQLKYVIGENNYVISKINSDDECVKFDLESNTVEALTGGSAIVTYIDRFHKEIKFQITVSEEAKEFKFSRNMNAIIRPGSVGGQYYVNYDIKPFSSNSKIKWEIEGDQSVIEEISDDYEFRFRPLKAGAVTLRGTTENGLTDTCEITVSEGNYISGFNKYEERFSIKEGETLNLKQLAFQNALPEGEDVSDDVITYTVTEGDDVVKVSKDGVLTTKKEGKATVRVTTFGGQWMDFYVSVTDGINGISFEQDYYSIPWKLGEWSSSMYSSLTLKTDPSYAIAGINANDIKFTASDGYELQSYISQNGSEISINGYIYYPGDFTVTAEYNGMKCNATVHVYEEKEQTELTLDKKIDIRNGFTTAIPYSFGKEEKTECTLELMDNSGTLSLSSSKASGGVFSVKALKKGTTKIRVTSVDNPALYKDIVVHVKDSVKDDYSFTLFYNDEEVKPDSTGTYVMKYGKEYKYEFLSKSKPNTNYAVFPKLVDTGAITSAGGAGCGLFEDKKLFGESGGSKAGKTGLYIVELWPGASLKFRIISDFERAESGASKIHNNTADNVQIDESQLGSLQNQLTEELPDKITKDSLNATVESISESSDDLIGLSETAKVQLDTDTTVSLSEDGKKLIYNITPSITVKACEGSNGRTIGEKEADVDKSVEMTLPTGNFINPDEPVYITHIKEDGTKYVYEGTYNEDDKTVSFTDPHGYSTFEITQDKGSVPSDAIKPGVSDKNTTVSSDNKKADSVKPDKKKAVDTSDHSNIGMYAVITLSGMIIAVITIIFRMKHSKVN